MNHDITHCAGEGCTRRGKCHRYMAHLDRNGGMFRSYTYWRNCADNGYKMYWPDGELEPQTNNKNNEK